MIKTIYILWFQGFENANYLIKECLKSWITKNSAWNVIQLSDKNLTEYVNVDEYVPNINKKNISKTALSDVVRIMLLKKYGGLWVDATTYCIVPLDDWLEKYINNGFWAFDKPGPDRLISSWFLYGENNNYIISKWYDMTQNYWKENNIAHNYFWFHYLFNNLYETDFTFKNIWDSIPKISADGPHFLQSKNLLASLSSEVISHVTERKATMYKLSYKFQQSMYNDNCNLAFLLTTNRRNQISNHTSYDRYPNIFSVISSYVDNKNIKKILSFGCSTGEELYTIDELYFKNKIIHGYDIDTTIIRNNNNTNKKKANISFVENYSDLENESYDIIFCMSILCKWPDNQESYSFNDFEHTLSLIDKKLQNNGYLVIYNAQYLFTDTHIAKKFIPIRFDDVTDSGFVKKYTKDFKELTTNYDYFLFQKINQLENITFASYKVSTTNLGDHIQIIANLNLLVRYHLKPTLYIDRDNEIKSLPPNYSQNNNKLLLVMNGWHKTNSNEWPPNDKIIPIFIGFHIRLHQCDQLMSNDSINYYNKYQPIGCRDVYTQSLLQTAQVECFESNCLTLTFPTRQSKDYQKIFVSSRDHSILQYLPSNVTNNSEFINHYSDTSNFNTNMERAQQILDRYQNEGKLVITTFLHCALPCIAMGIPVIVFYPNSSENINKSDEERFSSLSKLIKIYKYSEMNIVEWNPKTINIDNIKKNIIEQYKNKLLTTIVNYC